jgi:hypothetical protein
VTEENTMPDLTAQIPHQLTRAEAKRRLQDELKRLRQQTGGLLGKLEETWTGDTMDFSAHLMGQSISGHLAVEDKVVHLEVALPWLLSLLAGPVKQRIEQEGGQLLSRPKTP